MAQLVQALVLGILIGGVYALMASGLTLIFGVMRIINIAQGAFLILVATVTWWLWRETGIDPIIASVITTPMMFAFGWVLYRTVVSRIRGQSPSMSVLLTFGIALVIEGILNVASGNKFRSATPATSSSRSRSARSTCPSRRCTGSSPRWSCSPGSTWC